MIFLKWLFKNLSLTNSIIITPVHIDLHWLQVNNVLNSNSWYLFLMRIFIIISSVCEFLNHLINQHPIFLNFYMITNAAVLDCVPQIFIFFRNQDQITLSVIVHLPFVLLNYGTISPLILRTVVLYLTLLKIALKTHLFTSAFDKEL